MNAKQATVNHSDNYLPEMAGAAWWPTSAPAAVNCRQQLLAGSQYPLPTLEIISSLKRKDK
jgi:hypothetical protein